MKMKMKISTAEEKAYQAGKTASARIGEKAPCYDPIMESLIIEAKSPQGRNYNQRVLKAWYSGRGWKIPESD